MVLCIYATLFASFKFDLDFYLLIPIPALSVLWAMYVGFEPNNPNSKIKNVKVGNFDWYISNKGMWKYFSTILIVMFLMWIYEKLIPFLNN